MVVGFFTFFVQAFEIFIVNPRYIPNHVGQHFAIGVIAFEVSGDRNAGEFMLINGKFRHFIVGKLSQQRYRIKAASLFAFLFKGGKLFWADLNELLQARNGLFHIWHFFRDHF
ncbi:Uncharacterised protein [Vibrio cholerae]|uniref:Uncharacterized protein n=1 Tax=Vibrio cholerae TaxID=666 RepID=A0A655V387_VIBCL|nr:Uncharacterised protein [Vibrio cholerae]CSB52376.1 Uncharacterised protein [Vibrio cholerae]CSB53102.1 Uncharacterised protein [Vibrio cholerae]CSB61194.1 Uncharacterised protein [Vibrio cholerae]CSC31062.1 Uncharacterised protein [Vibrio cholerae]